MHYDIAAKVLLEKCRGEILRRLLGLSVSESTILEQVLCLMPFVPLMRHGEELVEAADSMLYESHLSRQDRADMLTVMTIFSGLISEKLPRMLVSKRRDIMIESAAYDIIKQEGRLEGLNEGRQEGLKEGRLEGKIEEAKEAILDTLETRFDLVPDSIAMEVRGIDELRLLKALRRNSVRVATLDEFKALLKKAKE